MPKAGRKRGAGWSRGDAKKRREEVRCRREQETDKERTERLNVNRERAQSRITTETEEERRRRQQVSRNRVQRRRSNETEKERLERQQADKERAQKRRSDETVEGRLERQQADKERAQKRRSDATEEERLERQQADKERAQKRRSDETEEERTERLRVKRQRAQTRRREETVEKRRDRLSKRRKKDTRERNSDVGEMTKVCPHCRAILFNGETANFCCMGGKVNIAPLRPLPEELLNLYTSDTPQANDFRKNLRQYNCLFQLTSFGAKEVTPTRAGWNPSVIIQGQIHHCLGSLVPDEEQQAQFLQIYFLDPQDSIDLRMNILRSRGTQRKIVEILENVIRQNNPYIASLELARERMRELPEASIVIDPDRRPAGEHERRFNKQTANEVAVVIPQNNEAKSRHIVLKERGGRLQIISESHRSYDSFQYILFFPLGDDGWHHELKMTNNKKLTAMRFYAHRLMIRRDQENHLLRGGRLFQQYLVDMAAKIETDRLNYIRLNQASLRSTTYRGLTDALGDKDDLQNLGKRVILSSTFVGGPRYMMERCQDAMMYVRKYGNASLFITMTCNPNWSEIRHHLLQGQQPCDRPDLIARVFNLKRKLFINYLTGPDGLFGHCIAFVSTVEYQKRGLPHLHCLIWLDEATKPRPQDTDQVVQAEIPDPEEEPELHNLVLKHMIHGPFCNSASPCWKNGSCSKRFPKPYVERTHCGDDAYPVYRRRSPDMGGHQGCQEGRANRTITSAWVVPYNPTLLKLFQCHINVEICSSVKSIKYVIKYTLKGSDQAVCQLNRDDEIAQYLTGRYIGPSEAVAAILGFPVHEREPAVVRLQVHLPQEQRVFIHPDSTQQMDTSAMSTTTLTEFMELCSRDSFARRLLYAEVPRYYTWTNKKWQRRKVGKVVEDVPGVFEADVLGRVYTVSPRCGDLYYLRLLLHHVQGPTSFQVLKTHDGVVLKSFKGVCRKRGLLLADDHWEQTMEDAERTRLPGAMRDLFVVLLTNTELNNPEHLWERFKDAMSEDYVQQERRRLGNSTSIQPEERHYDQALQHIQDRLEPYNKRLEDYQLPRPSNNRPNNDNPDLLHELQYDKTEQQLMIDQNEPLLNKEQRALYDHVCECLAQNIPSMIFVDAPGGTGKTFLTNLILSRVRGQGDIAIAVASSGIAATLMPGGRTAHSRFKIPLQISDNVLCNIEKNSNVAALLRRTTLIVWDECPMIRRESLEAVDRSLRDICEKNEPFGRILTICCGDFRQLLPVVKRGNDADVENACIKQSYLWRAFIKFNLRTNMRLQEGEGHYSEFLLQVGEDRIAKNVKDEIDLPDDMILQARTMEDCLEFIYPSFEEPSEVFSNNCILVPLNDMMRQINSTCIRRFPGDMRVYCSYNTVTDGTEATHFPTEFLDSVEISGLPPHKLELKRGSPIMLMRNLDPPRLCNGTRMIVKDLHDNLIVAKINQGRFKNDTVMIPRITINITEGEDIPSSAASSPSSPASA